MEAQQTRATRWHKLLSFMSVPRINHGSGSEVCRRDGAEHKGQDANDGHEPILAVEPQVFLVVKNITLVTETQQAKGQRAPTVGSSNFENYAVNSTHTHTSSNMET